MTINRIKENICQLKRKSGGVMNDKIKIENKKLEEELCRSKLFLNHENANHLALFNRILEIFFPCRVKLDNLEIFDFVDELNVINNLLYSLEILIFISFSMKTPLRLYF